MYFFFITYYVHYAMIKRKNFFFSFRHYVQYAIVTEKEIWFLLNHYFDYATIMKKLFFFISLGRSLWKYLLTWSFMAHDITNLLKKFPDGIVPGKSMCNLKTSSSGISVESYMIYFPLLGHVIKSCQLKAVIKRKKCLIY